jgi:hypothetical protein
MACPHHEKKLIPNYLSSVAPTLHSPRLAAVNNLAAFLPPTANSCSCQTEWRCFGLRDKVVFPTSFSTAAALLLVVAIWHAACGDVQAGWQSAE